MRYDLFNLYSEVALISRCIINRTEAKKLKYKQPCVHDCWLKLLEQKEGGR